MSDDLFAGVDAAEDRRLEAAGYRRTDGRDVWISPEGLYLTRERALARLDAQGRPVDPPTQEGQP